MGTRNWVTWYIRLSSPYAYHSSLFPKANICERPHLLFHSTQKWIAFLLGFVHDATTQQQTLCGPRNGIIAHHTRDSKFIVKALFSVSEGVVPTDEVFSCPTERRDQSQVPCGLIDKGTKAIARSPTLQPTVLRKAPLCHTIALEIDFQLNNLGDHSHSN